MGYLPLPNSFVAKVMRKIKYICFTKRERERRLKLKTGGGSIIDINMYGDFPVIALWALFLVWYRREKPN
jgi:hypothetical protein